MLGATAITPHMIGHSEDGSVSTWIVKRQHVPRFRARGCKQKTVRGGGAGPWLVRAGAYVLLNFKTPRWVRGAYSSVISDMCGLKVWRA